MQRYSNRDDRGSTRAGPGVCGRRCEPAAGVAGLLFQGVQELPAGVFAAAAGLGADPVLATSLYEDPSAGLHEDASARLREHPALLGCSILRRTSPPSSAGGHQHPAGGHEKGTVAITESDRILGHCTAGQLPNPYSGCSAVGLPERACRSAGLALVSVPCPGLDVACGPLACSSRRASKVIAGIAADHSPNPVVASFRGGQAAKRC